MNLALFDFDGTITEKDIFTDFIYYAAGRKRLIVGKLYLAPIILGYKLGIISPGKTREIVAGFAFRGRKISDLYSIGMQYSNQEIPQFVRPKALKKIRWHKSNGDKVVVVSASLDVYLKYWCDTHKLDLICSRFEIVNGLISGKYDCGDCSGKEKAKRIRENYDIEDYQVVYAYGDTAEDKEMLEIANRKYFRWRRLD